ncbi:phenolic acid decarboxylase [Roseomonas gilardii]|uniref:Phenolic acid decarboxylase n=1 Tax=Roseomonas gilardii TaxID=257708 RepID=A0ABU3MJH1_9PROT|nr:phenolic acid decarboxylase [Roseomonas gilardii]MDT8333144.1 phenolic acid decarboxylase [Roseomonas gilardii]
MPGNDDFTPQSGIASFVGTHFIYTYANGWKYEWYARNERTCDYRIHHGLVGGRWVTRQAMNLVQIAPAVFKADWHEPTGTCVSLCFDTAHRFVHGTIFFPQWIAGKDGIRRRPSATRTSSPRTCTASAMPAPPIPM